MTANIVLPFLFILLFCGAGYLYARHIAVTAKRESLRRKANRITPAE